MEILQTTTVTLRTWTGQSAIKIEKRAFRIKNGRWSLWTVEGEDGIGDGDDDVVGRKLADLVLGEVRSPVGVGEEEVQKVVLEGGPWRDGLGVNDVAVEVWVGRGVCWRLMHRIERVGAGRGAEGSEVCYYEFWPLVEGVGEGGRE